MTSLLYGNTDLISIILKHGPPPLYGNTVLISVILKHEFHLLYTESSFPFSSAFYINMIYNPIPIIRPNPLQTLRHYLVTLFPTSSYSFNHFIKIAIFLMIIITTMYNIFTTNINPNNGQSATVITSIISFHQESPLITFHWCSYS